MTNPTEILEFKAHLSATETGEITGVVRIARLA